MHNLNVIEQYIDYITIDLGLSNATLETYSRQLLFFIDYLKENHIDVNTYTAMDVHNYINFIQHKKVLKSQTIDLIITVIKSYLKYQQLEGIRTDDPLLNFELPKLDKRIPKILSKDTMQRIIEAPDENIFIELRDKTMMELLYATGLRSSELTSIKFENINFENSTVRVIGKGNKERLVPLALVTLDLLKKYIYFYQKNFGQFKTCYIFASPKTGKPLSRQNLFLRIQFYAKK